MTHSKFILAILMLAASLLFFNGCYTTMGMASPNDVVVEERIEFHPSHLTVTKYVWEDPDEWDWWPEVQLVQVYPVWPVFYDPDLYISVGCHFVSASWHKPWRHYHDWDWYHEPNWYWYDSHYYYDRPWHHSHHPVIVYNNYHSTNGHWRSWAGTGGHRVLKDPGNRRNFSRTSHTVASRAPQKTSEPRSSIQRTQSIQKQVAPQRTARVQTRMPERRRTTVETQSKKIQKSRETGLHNVRQQTSTMTYRSNKKITPRSNTAKRKENVKPTVKERKQSSRSVTAFKKEVRKESKSIKKQSMPKMKPTHVAQSSRKSESKMNHNRTQSVRKQSTSHRRETTSRSKSEKKSGSDKRSGRSRR